MSFSVSSHRLQKSIPGGPTATNVEKDNGGGSIDMDNINKQLDIINQENQRFKTEQFELLKEEILAELEDRFQTNLGKVDKKVQENSSNFQRQIKTFQTKIKTFEERLAQMESKLEAQITNVQSSENEDDD